MNKTYQSIIFAVAIIAASYFIADAYTSRNKQKNTISVTGLGSQDFTSDLIVWEGRFSAESKSIKEAYTQLNRDKQDIIKYLKSKGISKKEIIFKAVQTDTKNKATYNDEGEYVGTEFDGYILKQEVRIESKGVEKVESVSREITELLNQGIQFYSYQPRYYYTKLANLKIDMISKATEDARIRAENISKNSGGNMDGLLSAQMGIFQITGQNSGESFTWGGAFNTSSKKKTASITMKLVYAID